MRWTPGPVSALVDLPDVGPRTWELVWAAIVFVAIVVGALVLRQFLQRTLDRGREDRHMGRQLGRFIALLVTIAGGLYSLDLAGVQVGPLLGALGVGGIAVAFAAQDILQNLLAGIMIQLRRPFRIGDQITSMNYEGTVVDVDLRAVRLHTYDGLDVILPNAAVLRAPITNRTRTPVSRTTLGLGLAYDTDLEEARRVLLETLEDLDGLALGRKPTVWVEGFGESAINVAVMFWHRSDMHSTWESRHRVAVAVKRALDGAGITIPFPQRVVWSAGNRVAGAYDQPS